MSSLAVWQDTSHIYKNLVYDLAHHESPIAQWLERSTDIWKVMSLTPVEGSENSFSAYFDLRTLLNYLYYCTLKSNQGLSGNWKGSNSNHQRNNWSKYLPVQFLPLPWYPLTQRHIYEPSVLVHRALGSHPFSSKLAHSLTSIITDKIWLLWMLVYSVWKKTIVKFLEVVK